MTLTVTAKYHDGTNAYLVYTLGVLGARGAEEHGRVVVRPPVHQDLEPQAQQRGEKAALHRPAHCRCAGDGAEQGKSPHQTRATIENAWAGI